MFIVIKERYLIHVVNLTGCTVLILGIHIATTHARHHIDQVELNDTGDIAPLILAGTLCFLFLEFQIHTRSQSHLVLTDTIVTILILRPINLPFIIGGRTIPFNRINIRICLTLISKIHITGQVS